MTDASGIGCGAVLRELEKNETWRPVFLISHKLKRPEEKYTSTENEAGAVIFTLKKLRPWLDGKPFELSTGR